MTEGAQFVLGGILVTAALVEHVIDYVLTVKALDKGAKEIGSVAGKVVAKWGEKALPLFTFLTSLGVLVLAAIFGSIGNGSVNLIIFGGGLSAGLAINLLLNKLRK